MRVLIPLCCVLALGCDQPTSGGRAERRPPTLPVGAEAAAAEPEPDEVPEQAPPKGELPADLRTRVKGSDWPGFLGPTGDSVSPEKGVIAPWPEGGPRVVWQKQTGVGYSVPSVSRGRLYLFDRVGNRARLNCWNSETAEPLWTFEYPTAYRDFYGYDGGPRCCPVVDGDRVYLYGAEGMLHCVRAADGKLVWRVNTKQRFGVVQNFFGVGSTPVVEGDLLLVHVGGSPEGSGDFPSPDQKGNGTGLVAFEKYTGKVRYHVTDELASYASPVLATVGGRRWCFLFARGGLVRLDPATGKVDFRHPWRSPMLESVNAGNPVVVGNRVFISECYGPGSALLEIKQGTCKEVWTDADKARRDKSMLCHWSTPIHVDGYLYGCSGRHEWEAELRCIELATGKVMWSKRGLTRTSLLLVDGHFVCLGEDGGLRLLKVNPRKYEELSAVELTDGKAGAQGRPGLRSPYWAAPILSHGLLYIRGNDRLVCMELIPDRKQK
jgi:outer membrane protein assembly factor BamB